jgi:hypothetical protein
MHFTLGLKLLNEVVELNVPNYIKKIDVTP